MKFSDLPEILAPAGSYDSLTAAVRSGADAVYLGLGEYNARRNAKNFTIEELRAAVEYCHTYAVRVYLTLNISLSDRELGGALQLAADAYNAGVDAFIVADLGLARLISKNIPDARLHGSTQLTVHSPSALPILKKLGFKRIVLSREMSKAEISQFCSQAKKYGIETEVFVHGALCMCMSGQCYLSALLGSRSGNRGLCAAPCRLPFMAQNGTGYDLSLKDLSLTDYIDELKSLGVTSFKIEGRMKRPEYTASAVASCKGNKQDCDTLEKIFSRSGFTDGYYKSALGKNMFGIKTTTDDRSVLSSVHALYRNEPSRLPLILSLTSDDSKLILKATCIDDTVTVASSECEKAKSKPPDTEAIKRKLKALGSTPYFADKVSCDIADDLFVPVSLVSSLKNEAVERLNLKRTSLNRNAKIEHLPDIKPPRKGTPRLAARFASAQQIPDNADSLEFIVLPAAEVCSSALKNTKIVAELPRAAGNEKYVIELIEKAKANGASALLIGNIAHIELARNADMPFMTSFGLNIYNSAAAKVFEELGASAHLLPFETKASSSKNIFTSVPRGIISYGRLPVMLTRNCPVKNGTDCKNCDKNGYLTDRTGAKFPVRCNAGFSEIYNSVPLYLADKKELLNGFDFSLLFFTDEDKSKASEIISAYNDGANASGKFTRGLYLKGVE